MNDDLQQFGKLHFISRIKTCVSSFYLILPKTGNCLGSQKLCQINKEGHLLTGATRSCLVEWYMFSELSFSSVKWILKSNIWDFPGSPVVKNLPCNAGKLVSIPVQRTQSPHASRATKPEHRSYWACPLHISPCTTMKDLTWYNVGPECHNKAPTKPKLKNKR